MQTLLLTRPRPQSEAFAAAVEATLPGRFRPVVSPLVAIVPRTAPPDLEGIAALAFTSANGVAAFAALSAERNLPAYCVGPSTAAAARAAGFDAYSADGDATALAALIAAGHSGPVLHVRGAEAAAELAALLPNRAIRTAVLYDQVPSPATPEAHDLLRAGRIDVAAIFSPRSAARFAAEALASGWRLGGTASLAISAAADAPLAGIGLVRRTVAAAPSRDGMIEALRGL